MNESNIPFVSLAECFPHLFRFEKTHLPHSLFLAIMRMVGENLALGENDNMQLKFQHSPFSRANKERITANPNQLHQDGLLGVQNLQCLKA